MCFRFFCLSNTINSILTRIESHEPSNNNIIVVDFKNDIYKTYKSYKLKKIYCLFLNFLQVTIGLGITTLTILWYISISNNLVNLLSVNSNKYNLQDEKIKIKLLISEANKYMDNFNDYNIYGEDEANKIIYFKKCYQEILNKTPHEYLLYQGRRPSHATIQAKTKRLDIQKTAWGNADEITNINNVDI
jgi:hypothetical protein